MSAPNQTPTPKGGRIKQRPPYPSSASEQPEGRQLQPYFVDSVAGDAIQSTPNGTAKPKPKAKPAPKKRKGTTPTKQGRRPQNLEPGPARPAEQGYHSESGTAHFANAPRSRSNSMSATAQYPNGGVNGASTSQPLLPSDAKDQPIALNGTPAKQVYAGPNFLASPAASSLPMPKAFAKGMPTSLEPKTAPLNGERAQSTPIRHNDSFNSRTAREGSPLDFLFSADKAERQRQASQSASPLSSIRPQPAAHQYSSSKTLRPTQLQANRSRSHGASPSRKSALLQEMDGIDERSDSPDSDETPVTATYQYQMDALRRPSEYPSSQSPAPQQQTPQETQTEALKQMLFRSQQSPPPTDATHLSPPRNRKAISIDIGNNSRYPQYGSLSPMRSATSHMPSQQPRQMPPRQVSTGQRVAPSPAAPHSATSHSAIPNSAAPDSAVPNSASTASPADIKLMEDNLRKFLKIGS